MTDNDIFVQQSLYCYNKKFFCIYIFNYDSDLIFKNQRTRKYDNSSKIQFYYAY